MADKTLTGKKVAFLVANEGVEQVELTEPWKAVKESGGMPELVSLKAGKVQGFNHLDKGDTFTVDATVTDAKPDTYDALVLPGGVANPDQLRMDPKAVAFAKSFATSGKPIAVICHGPWTLVDEEVHVDTNGPGPIVSSRKPDDLKAFCQEMVDTFAGA